jgi:hypothetical protein
MQRFQSKMTHTQPTQQHINIVEHKQEVWAWRSSY